MARTVFYSWQSDLPNGTNRETCLNKAICVERATEGTSRLHSDYTKEPWAVEVFAKAQSKNRDPERCRKIAEFRRGKPRPPHVHEAMR